LDRCEGPPSVLYHDNYYRRRDELSYEEREQVNYDDLDAFDNDLFVDHLTALRAGRPIESPVYDFSTHNRSDATTLVEPSRVVIVEGILIFAEPRICGLLDTKLFVDTDADVRLLRRIKRDVVDRGRTLQTVGDQYRDTVEPLHALYVEPANPDAAVRLLRQLTRYVVGRGRTLQSVEHQYLDAVKPMHDLYVEPSKRKADVISPEGGHNLVAMDMILNRIQRRDG